ncbi:MAG: four helix bundle protein, partial [bacterium]
MGQRVKGKIEKFEDIRAWQKARELTNKIYKITKNSHFTKDFSLKNQLRNSAISIMANIAEGFARRTDKEFINFLGITHASVAELQSHLYVTFDEKYISEEEFQNIYVSAEEVSRLIQGFSNYLRNSQPLDSQTPDSQTPDSQTPDSQTPDSQTPDSQTPDSQT